MNRRRFILGMGAASLGGGAVLATGTSGFSRVESSREIRIQSVADPEAYLGMTVTEPDPVHCEGTVVLVTLTNQLKQNTTLELRDLLDVEDTNQDSEISISVPDGQLGQTFGVGESIDVEIHVSCPPSTDSYIDIQFGVTVDGWDSADMEDVVRITAQPVEESVPGKERQIRIYCECHSIPDGLSFVAFCGDVEPTDVSWEVVFDEDGDTIGVDWAIHDDASISQLVLFGGGLNQTDGRQEFLNFDVTDNQTSGTALIGDQDEAVPRYPPEQTDTGQTPDCPCVDPASGVKVDVETDEVESFDCT